MEYHEPAIRGRTNVELNVVGAEIESGFHGRNRVFYVAVFAGMNSAEACGVIPAFRMHLGRQSPMCNQERLVVAG